VCSLMVRTGVVDCDACWCSTCEAEKAAEKRLAMSTMSLNFPWNAPTVFGSTFVPVCFGTIQVRSSMAIVSRLSSELQAVYAT